ncbi:CBS domain-containing protein [Anaerosoma tenue]|uniref:CBS domain-containing protein n=1 Tax=Anaerosoma tenue TaxID=2933588 RepID=UPI001832A0A9|nr:CBS domain-containing protein [Anaerosoma tenue]MCK8115605.1 CBS domain-containing protein [Anaerosoma tenue]HHJ98396.1 CBS domain-containing protein [Actinomycetota bacterium]
MAALTARDIMTKDPITVERDLSVTDAARMMVESRVGALPVLDGDALIGLVTEGDLIMRDVKVEFPTYLHLLDGFIMYPPATARFESELKKAVGATVEDVMSADPVTVQADALVSDVATLMVDRDVSRVPVLDGDRLVGIISKSDIVRSLIVEG